MVRVKAYNVYYKMYSEWLKYMLTLRYNSGVWYKTVRVESQSHTMQAIARAVLTYCHVVTAAGGCYKHLRNVGEFVLGQVWDKQAHQHEDCLLPTARLACPLTPVTSCSLV
jgi:predicted N-acyltransferase